MPVTKSRPVGINRPKKISSQPRVHAQAGLPFRASKNVTKRHAGTIIGRGDDAEQTVAPETSGEQEAATSGEGPEQETEEKPEDAASEVAGSTAPEPDDEEPKKKKKSKLHPQERIHQIWKSYEPEYLGKVTKILPEPVPVADKPQTKPQKSLNASESYLQARAQCEETVKAIVEECLALNQKYTDVHFDLERDLKVTCQKNCLLGLVYDDEEAANDSSWPKDVKRVTDIFDDPKFFKDGAGFDDIRQGSRGDCWMLSAFSVLSTSEDLVKRVCVAQNQEVGVYGFVFFRDGEWHPTIIDDKLYMNSGAFDEGVESPLWNWGEEQEQKYTELYQRGSRALWGAKCKDENETWVPLLEKALAKAHGGYDAIEGGQTGEALEDLTGGVTSELYTTNILFKDKFWEDLKRAGKEYMFGAGDALYREWRSREWGDFDVSELRDQKRKGIVHGHAYAVLDTYEGHGERLVKVRNPWGRKEWTGAFGDGSKEWTAEWLHRLKHKFGDDGVFWMRYKDFLNNFKYVDRTRIFDDSWYTSQAWAAVQVPFYNLEYQQTKFTIEVPEDTETVITLSQLDDRYWQGLQGRYVYKLQFRISLTEDEDKYIARSRLDYEMMRSTNIELKLAKGKYTVLFKVEALDAGRPGAEEVIKNNLPYRKDKVMTIGRLYDLAHQKGQPEPEAEAEAETSDEDEKSDEKDSESDATEKTPASAAPAAAKEALPTPMPVYIVPTPTTDDDEDDEEEDEKDPFNAACIVGLRVYSKQPDLTVGVIWPPKPKSAEEAQPTLDRDDITKAPQEEAEKNAEGTDDEKEDEEEDAEEEEAEDSD